MFHLKCSCPTITRESISNRLVRCHRCHGCKIQWTIPELSICRLCRKPATIACAVCFNGMHQQGGCSLGPGANQTYIWLPNEQVSVCPDCAWNWVEFISKDPCKKYRKEEAEAITIVKKDNITTCPRKRKGLKVKKACMMNRKPITVDKLVNNTYTVLRA